ncbi:S-adenosyl-L-methionine-dependent methyltransferase [Annulohypoxylon truncatum]|uniref:S-adenosyl-L-methionine-dependent methyltransferase n=1 Tax=Annulohypoxylon truncatum TaxID=327061 RepID=UPI0020080D5A|nr:S-adenosyl-L-methionine-dependent methyltransferase [Annulohypoxylon truncatum]KAI1205771.1 S-adenosyl-L-methionine-dependent methyltransferase [Annulohypoxylon truncatum]
MASKTDYVFPRDFIDNTRINLMHHIWTKIFGYNIHPKIPSEAANLRIADVGTGTGIWLFDVRDKLNQAQLDGFDISFDAAPPSETLPPQVAFRHWDVKSDVPEDLVGVYDIINVRHFGFVLLNDDIPSVVAKLISLLKPGGYLQWGEADMETLRFDITKPGNKTDNLVELFKLLAVQDDRLKPTWVRHLPEIFAKAGFVDVEKDMQDALPHLAFIFHEAGLMIHDLIARKTKNEHMARELRRLIPAAAEETKQGAYGTSLRVTVIGRKP